MPANASFERRYKQSGVGRFNGEAGLDDFLEYKHISFNLVGADPAF